MHFNILLMNSSVHTQCYLEMLDGISWCLTKLGHHVTYEPVVKRGIWNIVFGARPGDGFEDEPGVILYNGEQVAEGSMWHQLEPLYRKHVLWDYSAENVSRHGLTASVVWPGYAPVLDRIPEAAKEYDVVFFGSKNERRQHVLDALKENGVRVLEIPVGVYGAERDALAAKAKYCLNIHYYEKAIFESVRCSYMMMNGIPVISESCEGDEVLQYGALECDYDAFVDTVQRMLPDDRYQREIATQRESAREIQLIEHVRNAVAKLPDIDSVMEQGEPLQQVDKRHKITLCMIVKNERDVIERCLNSVKRWITDYAIVDTGSTDGTQDLIRKCLSEMPGEVRDMPWREFDGSRNDALELAKAHANREGWLLFIDADEFLVTTGRPPEFDKDDAFDGYYGNVTRCVDCPQWCRPILVRASKSWFYEMPRHEGLYCREHAPMRPEPLSGAFIMSGTDGGRAKESARDRYFRDATVLEKWFLQHPGHTRCAYYIAQSYRDAASGAIPTDKSLLQKAIMWYQRRSTMPNGFVEETHSAFLQSGRLMDECGYPWQSIQQQLLMAFATRPERSEALLHLAVHYRKEGLYALAELFARRATLNPMSTDGFHDVDRSVYEWRAAEELAVCLTYLNGHAEALEINHAVVNKAPESERSRIIANMEMCKQRLAIAKETS